MIKIDNTQTFGWEAAIRGMRNPMNSWDKSDSYMHLNTETLKTDYILGPQDHALAMKLAKGGSVHAKYRRMIVVQVDILAPLYWWKEFDTYKVGTVANSCSTMHKIHAYNFDRDDFSHEKLAPASLQVLDTVITELNFWRNIYNNGGHVYVGDTLIDFDARDKCAWEQMIQLLPSSYNQKRTVMLNYEVLVGIYRDRKAHKLDEWRELCKWIETLPYSELITLEEKDEQKQD